MSWAIPWPKVLVLGGTFLALGFLWAWMETPKEEVNPTPWVVERAWPKREPPYVLLFTDPLCPFCGRLEGALGAGCSRGDLRGYIRYVPVLGHSGSYEAWLLRLLGEGWDETEARLWLEEGHREARASGVRITPVAVVVSPLGRKTVAGFSDYCRWEREVFDALGVGP